MLHFPPARILSHTKWTVLKNMVLSILKVGADTAIESRTAQKHVIQSILALCSESLFNSDYDAMSNSFHVVYVVPISSLNTSKIALCVH